MRLPFLERLKPAGPAARTTIRNPVYWITLIVLLVVTVFAGLVLWQYWTSISRDARTRSATLAYLLAEQTTRTFQAVDLTLSGLEPVLETAPLPDHSSAFEKLLAQRVAELDFIHALDVVNAAGRVTQASGPMHGTDLSGQTYFQAFVRDPKLKFLIGHPLSGQPGMLETIPVVRRLETPDGRFDGMIVASVEPKYFRDFYRNLDLGAHASIDLYQDNGTVLLASTNERGAEVALPRVAVAPSFDLASNLGQFRSPSSAATQQFVAYHRAQDYPLVVAVGIDLADIRLRWWRVAAPTLGAMAAAAVLAVALAFLMARRLEERRRAQNRAMMMQKLEALGQMTASVSHDFRNLLAVMSSTLRLLRKHGPSEKILSAAEEAVERGTGLVSQLLAFSRRRELQVRPADLNRLVSGLVQVLRHAAGSDVALEIDTAGGLPACNTDQTQFDAALMNLVVNARQAMPQGGSIRVSTRRCDASSDPGSGFVELRVADTGTGISPEDMKRIFEPFFTTKAETGTGLGLSQVYGFMRQIGGDVMVSSTPGAGTVFRLLFPISRDDAPPELPAGRPESSGGAGAPSLGIDASRDRARVATPNPLSRVPLRAERSSH